MIKFDLYYNKIILSMEIQGYPNYLIYEDGKVEKIKGHKKGIINSHINNGYLQIRLTNKDGRRTFLISRLIAIYYIPNPLNYKEVDHIDRDKSNNDISNLRWCDRSVNTQNRGIFKNNKCGIKNIRYHKSKNNWEYRKIINGNKYSFSNKNKNIVLWCKFIHETLPVATGP